VEALFSISLLLHEFPKNKFLKKCLAAALYDISAYETHDEAGEKFKNYRDIQGEIRQVYYLIDKLSKRDINILALNYAWRLHKEEPGDEYLSAMTKELFYDLVFENDVEKSFFHTKTLAQLKADQVLQPEKEDTTAATGSRLRKKKHIRQSKIDTTFTKFAFVDLLQDDQFNREFQVYYDKKDSVNKANETRNNTFSPFPLRQVTEKKPKKHITSFVMTDPYTVKMDDRKRNNLQYEETELNLARVKELMTKNASLAGINMETVDTKNAGESGAVAYNRVASVNEYIEERFNQSGDGIVLSVCKDDIDSLMQSKNTHFIGWTAIICIQKKKPILLLSLLSILPYTWPYTIYEFIVPKIHTYYYHVLFDTNTGKLKIAKVSRTRSDLRNDQLNSHIFDFMYSIKRAYE
jgi:hypothetical protein